MQKNNLTGQRFGSLTVIADAGNYGISKWICKCDCGNEKTVYGTNLLTGQTRSCGCGKNRHGDSRSKLYNIHAQMVRHGVCDEWSDYTAFRSWAMENGYKPGVRFKRLDSTQPYGPENCVVMVKD